MIGSPPGTLTWVIPKILADELPLKGDPGETPGSIITYWLLRERLRRACIRGEHPPCVSIPIRVHGMIDYGIGILLIAAPHILGFATEAPRNGADDTRHYRHSDEPLLCDDRSATHPAAGRDSPVSVRRLLFGAKLKPGWLRGCLRHRGGPESSAPACRGLTVPSLGTGDTRWIVVLYWRALRQRSPDLPSPSRVGRPPPCSRVRPEARVRCVLELR
jgi:hypothetical protein